MIVDDRRRFIEIFKFYTNNQGPKQRFWGSSTIVDDSPTFACRLSTIVDDRGRFNDDRRRIVDDCRRSSTHGL
ncbi:MAG: hypothetical protein GY820_28535 [Gammaproteobacteria bacterium]|nr:hypothetical protein [Gammaproteobacteria bacterium]